MKTAKTAREEYIAFRLNEWGSWIRADNSLLAHLGYRSWLGVMEGEHNNHSTSKPNEDECEKVDAIFRALKHQHRNDADCIYLYYVKGIGSKRAADKLSISTDTFGARRKAGERFISGGLG